MNARLRFLPYALCIVLASALAGNWWVRRTQGAVTEDTDLPKSLVVIRSSFEEAQRLIEDHYAGSLENDDEAKAAIQGMLRTLDPHSRYFDAKEFEELQSEQHSQYFGIGVSINRRNDRVYIVGTFEDAPAERAGLRYGDAIVAVNGKSALDWSTNQVTEQVKGPRGEAVEITVERAGVPKPLTFKISRDAVPLPSIRHSFMIRPTVGYIALLGGFNHTTEEELKRALEGLKAQGMTSLILDLRNNPGGLLNQAIKVSSLFLPRDLKVVSVKGRAGDSDGERIYRSESRASDQYPLVVLINSGTASASEIVAGAIQDHDRGLIVGEGSFGKGLVQTPFRLPFGAGLTLTTAKYYTPSGRCIQRDYSSISLYDYYAHSKQTTEPKGQALTTDTGRRVYSGGGISPDVEVKDAVISGVKVRLYNAAFDFTRQLIAGQIAGFPTYHVTRTVYNHRLKDDEFQVSEKVVAAFRTFLKANPQFRLTEAQVTEHLAYLRSVMREQMVTAAFGTESAMEVRLQTDEQTVKAIENIPAARDLAYSAQLTRTASRP